MWHQESPAKRIVTYITYYIDLYTVVTYLYYTYLTLIYPSSWNHGTSKPPPAQAWQGAWPS
jgi:hypothetical protein